jgi:type II secretory pathway predicted ATPase ExeA
MNSKKLLSLYGLKWNPFAGELPTEALLCFPKVESFIARVENLIHEGGFALIAGEVGTGKSVALRLLSERLGALRDTTVGVLVRPQSRIGDFYRELGDLFVVKLAPHNRWAGFKVLRERWKAHLESTLLRPVLLIDEAQEMDPSVLSELRLLSSANFDSSSFLTVVLAGDQRLLELLRHEDLLALGSRIRTRLVMDYATREELLELLRHAITKAGNPRLMTPELMETLVDHAAGNCRVLMNMAGELLLAAATNGLEQLDEKLYLEVFQVPGSRRSAKAAQRGSER